MLTTPKSILFGLFAIALAIVFQPASSQILVSEAQAAASQTQINTMVGALNLISSSLITMNGALSVIPNALTGMAACRL